MKIESMDGKRGVASFSGGEYDIRLDLIEGPQVGEFVMVHAGIALDKLDADEAEETLKLLREIDGLSGRIPQ